MIFQLLTLPSFLLHFTVSGLGIITITTGLVCLYFLRKYCAGGRCHSNARLDGKVAIITGANSGIGKETARDFIRRGAKVIMACRDTTKGEMVAAEIRSCATGNGSASVKKLDLASMKSIREFVKEILKNEPKIHLLINNAGIMACPHRKTEDNFELQFGTNHLGHFLLTNLLLPKMKESAPSRIVVVSSLAHISCKRINFSDLNSEHGYNVWGAYAQSKLANLLFARELHKKLVGSKVSVFVLHPGVIKTNLGRHLEEAKPWITYVLAPLAPILFKTPEEGAQTSIYCAVQEGIETLSGSYFGDCAEKKVAPQVKDNAAAKKLWEISERMVGIKQC